MNRIGSSQLLVIALGTLHFGNGVRGKLEEQPCHTVSSELLEKFAVNLFHALKDKFDLAFEFPTSSNSAEWHKYFKQMEDGTFSCKTSRLNDVWNEYRKQEIFYPMTLVRRTLYTTLCQVQGCAEKEDYDSF